MFYNQCKYIHNTKKTNSGNVLKYYNCVVMTVLRIMEVSVVLTFVTGAATTSCDTNHGESLLKDGVTVGEAPSVLSVGL